MCLYIHTTVFFNLLLLFITKQKVSLMLSYSNVYHFSDFGAVVKEHFFFLDANITTKNILINNYISLLFISTLVYCILASV